MKARNVAIKLERISKESKIACEVEGGWIYRMVDEDGVLVEDGGGHTIFIPESLIATLPKAKKR